MKAPLILLALVLGVTISCANSENRTPRGSTAGGEQGASAVGEVATRPGSDSAAAAAEHAAGAGTEVAGEAAGGAPGPASRGDTPATPPNPVPAQADSAGRILERAAARYAELSSLQANFSMTYDNPLLRSRTTGAGVMYQQRPDRLLLRFSEPAGDIILSDGRYFWLYYPSVDAAQVLRSDATAGSSSGVDLQAQFLGDPTRRFAYTLDGEDAVGGRRAWQLTLKPRERLGYRQLRVWIDQRDHLARRFEITEDNGSVRSFELRNLRIDPALRDDLFRFDVPPGARVISR